MKKSGLIFAVLIAVLLVSGQGCEKTTTGGKGVFIGGKSGLIAEFVDDAPATSGNYKDEAFPIEIRLTNNGETDIGAESVNVYLTGALFSETVASVSKKEATNDDEIIAIEEGTGGNVIEDSAIVSLGDVTYTADFFGDSVPLDVSAAVCYPYETKIQINDLCIPSTLKRTITEDECEVDSVNLIDENDNSGAPVQITSLREDEGANYIRLVIDINNVGSGDVVNECKRDITRDDLNEVRVTMPNNFDCSNLGDSNTGNIELRNGHATLRCTRAIDNPGSAYEEPIQITLGAYNYRQELSKTITINKA